MAKQVTFLPGNFVLRNLMVPSYFSTIPLQIHKPSPVPLVDFVVKKGSNSRFASSERMPDPVSKIEISIPGRCDCPRCDLRR